MSIDFAPILNRRSGCLGLSHEAKVLFLRTNRCDEVRYQVLDYVTGAVPPIPRLNEYSASVSCTTRREHGSLRGRLDCLFEVAICPMETDLALSPIDDRNGLALVGAISKVLVHWTPCGT